MLCSFKKVNEKLCFTSVGKFTWLAEKVPASGKTITIGVNINTLALVAAISGFWDTIFLNHAVK